MEITDPGWHNRYTGTAGALAPAIERFGRKELEALEEAVLNRLLDAHPRLGPCIQHIAKQVIDPIVDLSQWYSLLPYWRKGLAAKLNYKEEATAKVRQYGMPEALDGLKEEFDLTELLKQNIEEAEQKLPVYKAFLLALADHIKTYAQDGQKLVHLALEEKRNEILRNVLPESVPWLFGWGVRHFVTITITLQKQAELWRRMYNELKANPMVIALLPDTKPISEQTIPIIGRGVVVGYQITAVQKERMIAESATVVELQGLSNALAVYYKTRVGQIMAM